MRSSLRIIALLVLATATQAEQPPNIVLLIGDDHGYPYFGFMGDDNVVTPTMDAIAAGGVTFSNAHVTVPYCRPSLRTMITGLYPVQYQQRLNAHVEERIEQSPEFAGLSEAEQRTWVSVEKANGMRIFDTLPKLLKQQGYVSWQGGKWWENGYSTAYFDEGMTDGWDMSKFGTDDFFHEMMGGGGNELVRETMAPLYDFIDRQQDKPMFIWFGPMLPHTPFDAPYSYMKYYEDMELSESAKRYYANITWWDHGVSQLMDYMEAKGLLDNTLFIYLSDNGWEQDPEVEYWYPGVSYYTDSEWATGGLKGKGSLYDLGLRTPMIFYWKDKLRKDFNESSLVSSVDLVPTILDVAGADVPDELPGLSLKPLLTGEGEVEERTALVNYTDNRRSTENVMGDRSEGYSVRTGQYHFYWYADSGDMRLYDISLDPRGDVDLSEERPDLVRQFMQEIAGWKESIGMTEQINIYE